MSFTLLTVPREKLDFIHKGNEIGLNWRNLYYNYETITGTYIHSLFHPIQCHVYRRLYQNKEIVHHRVFRLYTNKESPTTYKIVQFDGLADDMNNPRTMTTHTITVKKSTYYRIQDDDPLVYIRDEVTRVNNDSVSQDDEFVGSGYYAHLTTGILYLGMIQPSDLKPTVNLSVFLNKTPAPYEVVSFFLYQNITYHPHIYDNTNLIEFATKYKLNDNASRTTLELLIDSSINGKYLH